MILLPIVRGLIERNCEAKNVTRPTPNKVWLTTVPKVFRRPRFETEHLCTERAGVYLIQELVLTQFLMDMKPQVGVLVYVGQCPHCLTAFFGEYDGDDAESPAGPPQERHPKGPRQRE